jgi:hypothetical protein
MPVKGIIWSLLINIFNKERYPHQQLIELFINLCHKTYFLLLKPSENINKHKIDGL